MTQFHHLQLAGQGEMSYSQETKSPQVKISPTRGSAVHEATSVGDIQRIPIETLPKAACASRGRQRQ